MKQIKISGSVGGKMKNEKWGKNGRKMGTGCFLIMDLS
jgi:hypothetical protein